MPSNSFAVPTKAIEVETAACKAFENGEFSAIGQTIQLADVTGYAKPEESLDMSKFAFATATLMFLNSDFGNF